MTSSFTTCLQELLHLETELRLYHWTTGSYARHKATDELYVGMREWIDAFLETAFGKDVDAMKALPKSWNMPVRRWAEKEAPERILGFARHIQKDWNWEDTGLLSLRDDLINLLHKAAYLFRLD